ncbi:MAG: FAD-dependent oxidoreductase, partial [Myxococcota bacterium]
MPSTRPPAHDAPRAAEQLRSTYDVVVVGAGPAGTATAVGYARRGATVLLVEANPKAAGRFAGEWIHPSGARILRDLDLTPHAQTAEHAPCWGFAVFPDDGTEPVRLDYDTPDGVIGFSCEHGDLVRHLRRRAAELPGLDYLPLARVTGLEGEDVRIQRKGQDELRVRAGIVVGADGRSSVVRKHLRGEEAADVVSHMAGLTLRDVEIPYEGYGTVLLGGPGPVLLYRIAPNQVRACIDLPASHPGGRRDARYLWEAFRARFPESLRGAFRKALESEKLVWACNRFHPRSFYGAGNIALVGDAVGFYHPLTASGITVGLKDGKALYEAPKVSDYHRGREPESYVPELLSNALNQVFVREDESAAAIRSAVFETWRKKPAERDRTMHILAGDEVRLPEFAKAFVKVAGQAITETLTRRPTASVPGDIAAFVEWAQWPAATAMPAALRRRIRGASSALYPMQGIKIRPSSPDLGDALEDMATVELDVDALLAKVAPDEGVSAHTPVFHAAEGLLASVREKRDLAQLRGDLAALVAFTPKTPADRRETARALAALKSAHPGLEASTVKRSLEALVTATRKEQRKDGAFGVSLAHTALGLETLAYAGVPTFD